MEEEYTVVHIIFVLPILRGGRFCRPIIELLCTQRKLSPLSHIYNKTPTPASPPSSSFNQLIPRVGKVPTVSPMFWLYEKIFPRFLESKQSTIALKWRILEQSVGVAFIDFFSESRPSVADTHTEQDNDNLLLILYMTIASGTIKERRLDLHHLHTPVPFMFWG